MGRKKKKNFFRKAFLTFLIILLFFFFYQINPNFFQESNFLSYNLNDFNNNSSNNISNNTSSISLINTSENSFLNISSISTLTIASWNIQNFGQSKASKNDVIQEITKRVTQYDIIAIQEITNINEKVDLNCNRNIDSQNSENFGLIRGTLEKYLPEEYEIKISPQVFNERYLFIYNSSKTTLIDFYFVEDSNLEQQCSTNRESVGLMLREPFIGVFNINNINITLMNVHTSPSNNQNELMALKSFYDIELEKHENLLLLGDLNFGCSYYPEFNMFNESIFIFDDYSDTNVAQSTCAYDRMIYDEPFIGSFVNFGIDKTITREISDHYLIWAELFIE